MENMVAESVKYTILGMGVVFLFLYILVLALRLQKNLIAKYFPEKEETSTVPIEPGFVRDETTMHRRKVAAMTAAIHHHKKVMRK
ncbi:OadG family protein [Hydrogenimonas sp.]